MSAEFLLSGEVTYLQVPGTRNTGQFSRGRSVIRLTPVCRHQAGGDPCRREYRERKTGPPRRQRRTSGEGSSESQHRTKSLTMDKPLKKEAWFRLATPVSAGSSPGQCGRGLLLPLCAPSPTPCSALGSQVTPWVLVMRLLPPCWPLGTASP